MDGNKQKRKLLTIEHKTLKWDKTNNAPPKDHLPWDDCDITFTITMTIKQRRFECIKCTNKRDELYDVLTYCTKFLKYDPS